MSKGNTIAFAGFRSEDEAAFRQAFDRANQAAGGLFSVAPETAARVVVIDVDSIYGHMAWLQAQHRDTTIVALTAGSRADADHLLARPVDDAAFAKLLEQLSDGSSPAAASVTPTAVPAADVSEPMKPAVTLPEHPEPSPLPAMPAAVGLNQAGSGVAIEQSTKAPAEPTPAARPPAPPAPPPPPPKPPRDPQLIDYLAAGRLPGPVKLKVNDAPWLVIDPRSQTWLGGRELRPLLPYASMTIRDEDWTAVTPHEFERLRADLGEPQPVNRLQWLAALGQWHGELSADVPEGGRVKLDKWPQIEREFPKHFRVATVMMKGYQTLDEIADASGATRSDVADFINACLATGFAVIEPDPEPELEAPEKQSLMDRLRSRRG